MTRRIDIDLESERLRIEFPYDAALVQMVKTLPERRWDPDARAWFVPVDHLERVVETLIDEHFKLTASLRAYCRERGEPVDELLDGVGDDKPEAAGPPPVPPDTLTVTDLNIQAKEALSEAFPESLWLVGELQGYDRNQRRNYRHTFFELVDRPAEDADPSAKVTAVMFDETHTRIEEKLEDAPDDVRLRDGLAVRVRVKVDLYAPQGTYQVQVEDIDPSYTTGRLQQKRQEILKRLDEAGIRENNRELAWPVCPLRVGLMTSQGSDACRDFIDELEASPFGFQVDVHDIYVQGDRTESSVLDALSYFEDHENEYDAVAVVRGGGARSDLAYFDTDGIGDAICRHPLKIVCGVGHEEDVSLLDSICESHKTPTAAAQAFVRRVEAFRERMDESFEQICRLADRQVSQAAERLSRLSVDVEHRVQRRLARADRRLSSLRTSLTMAARDRLDLGRRRLENVVARLPQAVKNRQQTARRRLGFVMRSLSMERIQRRLSRSRREVDSLASRLERAVERRLEEARRHVETLDDRRELLDPQRVLERGYALVWAGDRLVRSAEAVEAGDRVDVRLNDGEISARVLAADEADDHEDGDVS